MKHRFLRKLFLWALLLVFPFAGWAQSSVNVSPIVQKGEKGEVLWPQVPSFKLVGGKTADPAALRLLQALVNTDGKVRLSIGKRGDKAVKRYARLIPQRSEGYYLEISPKGVVIAGADDAGTYYGVQTFAQLLQEGCLRKVSVTDYPAMPDRGVIEGYYGNPYSHTDRLRLFDFMGKNKMNVFVYGPKDDPYHRSRWRENYPADEAAKMSELAQAARRHHVKFVWAVHPGGDIRWTASDYKAIVEKCESVYKLGVRSFCVFFDDITGEGTKGEKQAELLNYMTDNFVRKHSDVEPLLLCPTQYNKSWTRGDYLKVLGEQMYPEVRIMWTGDRVIDMIERDDMEWINAQIGRKAFIWLNYPVTDYCIDHLLMGKTYGNGLDIGPMVSGFCSNPMEYCEASKLSLYSIADYAWNPAAYDDEESWQRAIQYLMPAHADAFRIFCENNVDLGVTGHGLRRAGESPRFTQLGPQAADADYARVFAQMEGAASELLADVSQPELSAEIRPWVVVMQCVARRGMQVLAMREALRTDNARAFVSAYEAYDASLSRQRNVRSRQYDGSIKVAAPVVATNYVEPWMREQVAGMIKDYKKRYDYRLDIFPQQLVEDGKYFVKVNGQYLSDPDYALRNAPATLRAERDTINPQSQEWNIALDVETNRYSLVNVHANRYLNELCRFGTNPFSVHWNTYVLTSKNGRYAIQNAENGGTAFWTLSADGKTLVPNLKNPQADEQYIFELIPIE